MYGSSLAYLAMKGTCIASRYSSVAIRVASPMFLQSISQNLAETVVVKLTQSLTKVSGAEPVTSSHWALVCPPNEEEKRMQQIKLTTRQREMSMLLRQRLGEKPDLQTQIYELHPNHRNVSYTSSVQ